MKPAPGFGPDAVVVSEPKSDADNAHLIIVSGMLVMGRPGEPMKTLHAIDLDPERALEIASVLTDWARLKFAEESAEFERDVRRRMTELGISTA